MLVVEERQTMQWPKDRRTDNTMTKRKKVFWSLYCLSFFLLVIVLSVLLSFGHCIVCPSFFWSLYCLSICLLVIELSVFLRLTVMFLCARGVDFISFYEFSIGFWKYSDSVVFFVLRFFFFFFFISGKDVEFSNYCFFIEGISWKSKLWLETGTTNVARLNRSFGYLNPLLPDN
jgi:hypothetical protein